MEKIFEQALLYDFYGDLLTEHQKQVYEAAVFNDMSLGEIAAEQGISRQGVHDLIKRCDKILSEYEEKLHLAERFATAKKKISQIDSLTRLEEKTATDPEASADLVKRLGEIRSLTKELLDTL
ncbi:MAG: YlxM family DNA-binding protein [Lachnospiraceae bacterium]|nr:YlxM family DNA-binding protein [Lachnospiraceae bacterium]MBR3509602.1 YlxM family DNA-binding protein [Lachnospiraceae bacterium]MBR4607155.1 YlxM family DNA-binding protein [Lachnospiraceae bacterium]MBR6150718.1 YlxM family DNA-binding protein [Lachnospiraceae bacterium]